MTEQMDSRFLTARKNYIERQFSQLNDMQRQAVLTTEGSGPEILPEPPVGASLTEDFLGRIAGKPGRVGHEDILRANLEKLERRYPDGISTEKSVGRDKNDL